MVGSHLAYGHLILIQVFPELLQLEVSLPQLVLQVSDQLLVRLGLGGRPAARAAVRQGRPASPTPSAATHAHARQRARALAGRGAAAVRARVAVTDGGWGRRRKGGHRGQFDRVGHGRSGNVALARAVGGGTAGVVVGG